MSIEWNVVNHGNKKVTVLGTNAYEKVRQPSMNQKKICEEKQKQWEEKQRQNQAKWESIRQAKIDEYDRDFPLLPGSRDIMPDIKKIAYIDGKRASKKEADRLAYLEREAKRQEKRKIAQQRAEIKEREHVKNMIEKWGAHRWFRMVLYTDDDCDTAKILRDKEEEREIERERRLEEQERQWKKECEQQEIADKKYIAEQTANMTEIEKEQWISNFEDERMRLLDDAVEAEGDMWYRNFMIMEKQNKEDNERLALWLAKNKNK